MGKNKVEVATSADELLARFREIGKRYKFSKTMSELEEAWLLGYYTCGDQLEACELLGISPSYIWGWRLSSEKSANAQNVIQVELEREGRRRD